MTEYKAGDRFIDEDGDLWQVALFDTSQAALVRYKGTWQKRILDAARSADDNESYWLQPMRDVESHHGPLISAVPDSEMQQTTQDVPSESAKHDGNKPGDRFIDRDGDMWQVAPFDPSYIIIVRRGHTWQENHLAVARSADDGDAYWFLPMRSVESHHGPLISTDPDPEMQQTAQDVPSGGTNGGEIRTVSSTGGEKGVKLERFDLIPVESLEELARLYGKGAQKYRERGWEDGYEYSKSYAAMMRHANLFWRGVDRDDETGCHHLAAVAWHAFAMMEFQRRFPQHDDRPLH